MKNAPKSTASIRPNDIRNLRSDVFHKPGEDNQRPGRYVERGPRGGMVPKPRTVRIDRGDRLPPTQEEGHTWERV